MQRTPQVGERRRHGLPRPGWFSKPIAALVGLVSWVGLGGAMQACGPSDEERRAELVGQCQEASRLAAEMARSGQDDLMIRMMDASLTTCGEACGLDDATSCAELDRTLEVLCGANREVCQELCQDDENESVRQGACTIMQRPAPPTPAPTPSPAVAPPAPEATLHQLDVPAEAPTLGAREPRVVVHVFADFQCPFCARFQPTLDRMMGEYGDRIQLVWRDFALPHHRDAALAAQAAREVHRQRGDDAFWAFRTVLYENMRRLGRSDLERYAEAVEGIDMTEFRAALDSGRHAPALQADQEAVRTLGRVGTPTLVVGGEVLAGARPYGQVQAAVERALARVP